MVSPRGSIPSRAQGRIPVNQRYRRRGLPQARKEIRKLGLDPDSTPHLRQNNGSSAATGRDPGLLQIWTIGQRENIALCTFRYALEQARINLGDQDQRTWLTRLSRSLHLIEAGQTLLPSEICRPEKDLPILLATNEVRATLMGCTYDI